jgi:transposase
MVMASEGKTPHYNSIFNVLDKESLTPILEELITRSAMPLQAVETGFAVDSTGFGTNRFYRHFIAKHGKEQVSRDYVKVHASVGVKTHVITAAVATDRDTHDSPMLSPLVQTTAKHFQVSHVAADKAYCSHKNLELIESLGAAAYVPFKVNAVGTSVSSTWNRLFHFFHLHREEFVAAYHCRSNAESAFSAIKRKFGDGVRSKTPIAQRNEALLKVLCHNIVCLIHEMHESGAVAVFPVAPAAP